MSDVPSPQLRLSDTERDSAVQALGEHMSAGRISVDEYGERSARVTTVKTRGELAEIFGDLPPPHAELGTTRPTTADSAAPTTAPTANTPTRASWSERPTSYRVAAAAVPLSAILAVVLFFLTGTWLWFLLPCAVTVLGRSLFGPQWQEERRALRRDHRQQRRELRRGSDG